MINLIIFSSLTGRAIVTTGPTVLKFHMEHDLISDLRIVKLGQVEYPRWPLFLKIARKNQLLIRNHQVLIAEFRHGLSMEHRYYCKNEKKSVALFYHSDFSVCKCDFA